METIDLPKDPSNIKVEHLSEGDLVINLDAPEKDRKFLVEILKTEPLATALNIIEQLGNIYNPIYYIKPKLGQDSAMHYLKDKTGDAPNPIMGITQADFNRQAIYNLANVTNELKLSPKIKKIVNSTEGQDLAKRYFFPSLVFPEPILAITSKNSMEKYLIYKHTKTKGLADFPDEAIQELRALFVKNGIMPRDLRRAQILVSELGDLVLIDTEAYTEEKTT